MHGRVQGRSEADEEGQGASSKGDPDLRRSAVRNLRIASVDESVIMKISGHRTAEVFRRYNIVSGTDVTNAMRRLELSSDTSVTVSAKNSKRLSASRSK